MIEPKPRGANAAMLMLSSVSLLLGSVLAGRFTILILAPPILLMLLAAVGAAIVGAASPWSAGLIAAAAITSLQIGYLVGVAVRYVLEHNRARLSRLGGSLTSGA